MYVIENSGKSIPANISKGEKKNGMLHFKQGNILYKTRVNDNPTDANNF